jgi:hypothetical protein
VLVLTSLGSIGDTTARSANTCAVSRAPSDNALVLVSVINSDTVGTAVEPTTVAGAGLTFALVGSSLTFNPTTPGSQVHNMSLWRAMGTGLNGSVITADWSGNGNTGCAMLVEEISGVSIRGNNGEAATGHSNTSASNASLGLVVVANQSAGSTINGWYCIQGQGTAGAVTVDGDWVQSTGTGYGLPSSGLFSAYTLLSTGTRVRWSTGGNENRGGIIVEIVAEDTPPSSAAGGWLHSAQGHGIRAFPPRTRNEYWVEVGHQRSSNPATDTREG